MIYYQTRYEDGVFIGIAHATPDPREPARMVVPGACVETAPPAYGPGHRVRWEKGAWLIETDPHVYLTDETPRAGVAVSWTGEEISMTRVQMPDLSETQMATWDGKRWHVEDAKKAPIAARVFERSPAEKLAALGLSVADLKKLLIA